MIHWPTLTFPPINLWTVWAVTDSPCVNICKMDGGVCIGCGRTLKEIADWQKLTKQERADVKRNAMRRLRNKE